MGREYTPGSLPYHFTIGYYLGCNFPTEPDFGRNCPSNEISQDGIKVLD